MYVLATLATLARFAVGSYFVWSGSRELRPPGAFWEQVMGYRLTSSTVARVLASLLPPVEFVSGLLFAAGILPWATGGVVVFLLFMFMVAIGSARARKLDNDGGCGGTNRQVQPLPLVRNAVLAALTAFGALLAPRLAYPAEGYVAGCGAALIVALAVYRYRQLGR